MVRPARMEHLRAVEPGRAVDVHHPARCRCRHRPSSRCGGRRRSTRSSGPRALASDVQHPSPSFFQRRCGSSAMPALGHGNMPPAWRPSGGHLKRSMLTSVLSQTSSRLSGASIGKRVTVAKSHLLVLGPGVDPVAAVRRVLPQRQREAVGELRVRPVPSQLTMKISGGPGTSGSKTRCGRRPA